MLNFPLGPVDTTLPYTRLVVDKQPCDLPWVRRVTLPIGEHAIQGDIRMYLADPYGRRLQAAGVITATYVDHLEVVAEVPAEPLVFDGQTNTGSFMVDGKRVDVVEGRVQVPGQQPDNVAPDFSPESRVAAPSLSLDNPATIAPQDAQPIAPVLEFEVPQPIEVESVATEITPAATINEAPATVEAAPVTVIEPIATEVPSIDVATTLTIGEAVAGENAVITASDEIPPQSAAAIAQAIRRRRVSTKI